MMILVRHWKNIWYWQDMDLIPIGKETGLEMLRYYQILYYYPHVSMKFWRTMDRLWHGHSFRIGKNIDNLLITLGCQSVWPDGYIIIQYFTIYNNDDLPNSIKMPKVGTKVCQIRNETSKNCTKTCNFAKVVKFHQIWPHCWHQIGQKTIVSNKTCSE